jgi:Glycosyl hydrolase family 20, catalytic domain.
MEIAEKEPMWAYLIHLGYNMWFEQDAGYGLLAGGYAEDYCTASDNLRFDKDLWDELINQMEIDGLNTLVIDLGEGLCYESHPEISVKGSINKNDFRQELKKLREKGITPIPKLNFSTTHDEWMGVYSRCVSSPKYYEVCRDILLEVIDLFEKPMYFHIGMDEETIEHQRHNRYAVVRNGDQWWHDLYYIADILEKQNVCPWVWSDRIWHHEEEFVRKMPKELLQSNWYYDGAFSPEINYVKAYNLLDKYGYNQVPTGSNWYCPWNFEGVVNYCLETCNSDRIYGFLQTVWRPTLQAVRYRHLEAIDIVRQIRCSKTSQVYNENKLEVV